MKRGMSSGSNQCSLKGSSGDLPKHHARAGYITPTLLRACQPCVLGCEAVTRSASSRILNQASPTLARQRSTQVSLDPFSSWYPLRSNII